MKIGFILTIPSLYYQGHYLKVAEKIKEYINSLPNFLSSRTAQSPRAVGDAIESLIADNFNSFLQDWCSKYWHDFPRRAMADLALQYKEGFSSAIDVKTHREDTGFNMPNLTSVKRLAEFYESDKNIFALLMVKYFVKGTKLTVSEVVFSPIEFLDWECLTIGALGWGQIQIANSNDIRLIDGYSRKKWMLQFCNAISNFYPKEIQKIQNRIKRFSSVTAYWSSREDIWG